MKFTVPTVANGKVCIGTRGSDSTNGGIGELDVYALKPNWGSIFSLDKSFPLEYSILRYTSIWSAAAKLPLFCFGQFWRTESVIVQAPRQNRISIPVVMLTTKLFRINTCIDLPKC